VADRDAAPNDEIVTRLRAQLEQSRQQEALLKDTLTRLLELHRAQGPG
jgi:hypothetical protein